MAQRPLVFPLKNPLAVEGSVPSDAIDVFVPQWPTQDPNEAVEVHMEMSFSEFLALAEMIDIGRDIAYGTDLNYGWWLWCKVLKVIGTMPLDCNEVNNCIETTPAIQQNIANYANNYYTYPNTLDPDTPLMDDRFPSTERTEEIGDPQPSCDLDVLWAGILNMVTRLHLTTLDFLENLVAQADKYQRAAYAIGVIPFLGDIAESLLLALIENADDIRNGYIAYATQTVLEDIACDFFVYACNECRYPTFDEVLDYYSSFGITGLDDWVNLAYTAVIDYLIGTSGLANQVIFYTSQSVCLITLYLGGEWLGLRGSRWLKIWTKLGEDDPSSDWTILCETCPEPPFELFFDFTQGTQVPPLVLQEGTQAGTTGYWRTTDLANDALVWLRAFMYSNTEWKHIEFSYYRLNQESAPGSQALITGFPTDTLVYGQQPALMELDGLRTGQLEFKVRATSNQQTYHAADVYIYTMRVSGNGYVHPDYVPYMVYGTPT